MLTTFKLLTSHFEHSIRFRPCCCTTIRSFYDWHSRSDTIFALATAIQPIKGSPLAVVRLSGSRTSDVLEHLTKLKPIRPDQDKSVKKSKDANELIARSATLTRIHDPNVGDLIDIGITLWFPKPNSYTGEDSCEFHLHGSQAVIRKLISILGSLEGLRPAEAGEFTRRAVANGKITLMQAESLPELISSQTDQQRRLALKGLDGTTRKKYARWIDALIRILAHLEASIDFGEDELIGEQRVVNECIQELKLLSKEMEQFVTLASQCRNFVKTGVKVSILGRPNAGKSTLMNLLCRQEKSIVSDLSGTTRDVIEHSFDFNGHTLVISDTAGLRDINLAPGNTTSSQHDLIEREGIKRALQVAAKADLILYVIDGSQMDSICDELMAVIKSIGEKKLHLVINKIDLNSDINNMDVEALVRPILSPNQISISRVSCKTETNMDQMISQLSESLDKLGPQLKLTEESDYVNERHLSLLESTLKHLERASRLEMKNIDEMAQHVRESVDYLSRIVGTVSNEQVFDVIFRDFCIGK